MSTQTKQDMGAELARRWRLTVGGDDDHLDPADAKMSLALSLVYNLEGDEEGTSAKSGQWGRRGQLGADLCASAPNVSRWLGDIREYFPSDVVTVIQKDAMERLNLTALMTQPEVLDSLEPDINLVTTLMTLREAVPEESKASARTVIQKVVNQLLERLNQKTIETLRGAINRVERTTRPRYTDIDWPRTITKNLSRYQPEYKTVVPEQLVGFRRKSLRQVDLDHIVLCVDQSGSMGSSVVYSSVFAAAMASLPMVKTDLICFDTAVIDLSDQLEDPVDVLWAVQLGGGTDINGAVGYASKKIEAPSKAHFILISDVCEGGSLDSMLARMARMKADGVNIIVLLALTDNGTPHYDRQVAAQLAAMDIPVFACTPELFPDMMATALKREDVTRWASEADLQMVTADGKEVGSKVKQKGADGTRTS